MLKSEISDVAEADDGDGIVVWGDGTAVRAYKHVHDIVDAIYA